MIPFFSGRKTQRLAAIDIGTNSFHMVVVEWNKSGEVSVLDRVKMNVRLGSGAKDMKFISPDAMARGIDVLRTFARIARTQKAPVRAVATSAVREALNQQDFIRRAAKETGIHIEIVSGIEEARLIYLGMLNSVPVFQKKILMIDIGGGSVEYLIGKKGEPLFAASLKLGAIRLTQRFFDRTVLKKEDIQACRKHIRGFLSHVGPETERLKFEDTVGTSGTIQNICAIISRMKNQNESVSAESFTSKELDKAVDLILKSKTVRDRERIGGIDPDRADIIVAGALVLQESFRSLNIKKMTVSDFALREGIVFDYIQNRQPSLEPMRELGQLRFKSVTRLARQFGVEPSHSEHTLYLAMLLFDQLRPMHNMSSKERELLEYATVLHEIGLFVSHNQHHRHSYYLIRNSELPGFTDNEKEIIANIARYHRKSHPKIRHDGYMNLMPEDQQSVRKLAGILRIADALDRSHRKRIRKIECHTRTNKVVIRIDPAGDPDLEIWAVDMKKQLFEETFRKKVVIKTK